VARFFIIAIIASDYTPWGYLSSEYSPSGYAARENWNYIFESLIILCKRLEELDIEAMIAYELFI